ncbi:MAG: S41 family peptidase, partial [Actinomycetes bacterium]
MSSLRGALRVVALVAALGLAYVGGVVTGVVGSDEGPSREPGVIDEAADRIAAKAARPVKRDALERAAVEGMLRALDDRWSGYYDTGEFASFQAALEGHYSGVGLWLRPARSGGIEVGSVQPGSPAARADVRAGDMLVRVGAADVSRASVAETARLLRGEPGSTVSLVALRGDDDIALTLTRATFATDDVVVEHLRGHVSRVQITAFTRGVGREVQRALDANEGQHAGGLVLDLRDNPGGLLDEAVDVASVFLDGGPVVSYD